MNDEISIGEVELSNLLLNDEVAEKTLEKYFDLVIDDNSPFSFGYKLKDNVNVLKEPAITKSLLGESILSLANGVARHKRLKIYKKSIIDYPTRTRIVSEGDSWFEHPTITEIIDHLLHKFSILSLGAAGDDMSSYIQEAEYYSAIEDENPEFFLFSGGGNDLMGGHFGDYLNDYTEDINNQGYSRFFNQTFHEKVEQLIALYESMFIEIKSNFPSVKILVHGYDYVIPREGKKGRWLGKFMKSSGINSQADRNGAMRFAIDMFNEKLSDLSSRYNNVSYINLRGVIKPYQWHDEIHPDELGFQQIAILFENEINRLKSV